VELLIVLTLIGLVSSLALPRLGRMYDAVVFNFEQDDVIEQLAGLNHRVRHLGREMTLTQFPPKNDRDAAILLELPDGWQLLTDEPIVYRGNGVCLGGRLSLGYGEQRHVIALKPPFCQPGS
jgi:type II secretory pathway pseudopilin PulG